MNTPTRQCAAALGLTADNYATEGSLATRQFSVAAGDVLRLRWSFSSLDTDFSDHAFALIGSQVFTLATQSLRGIRACPSNAPRRAQSRRKAQP